MSALTPRLDVLPPPQRALWAELAVVPPTFVLYGGTGLALRLGHRSSVDFDFFSPDPLDHRMLRRQLPFLDGAVVLQEQPDALSVSAERDGPVKVSFLGPVTFGRLGVPDRTADGVVRVASLLDLAGTKIKALLQRVEAKDYLDVAAILRAGVPLDRVFAAARALFGPAFNPMVARKALAYFEGGDLSRLDAATRDLLVREALRDVGLPELAKASDRLD